MRVVSKLINIGLILLIIGLPKYSLANHVERNINKVIIEDKMNLDLLYVVESERYKEALNKDTLIINVKNNILSLTTDDVKEEELNVIKSSGTYYVLGPINNDVFPSENLGGHMFYDNKDSFINEDVDTNNNLIITNEESVVDVINAIQVGDIEERNILLIKDNRLTEKTLEYLKEYGEDKNILFLEGELEIPMELKKEILQIAGSPKYEIDTFKVSKLLKDKKVDLRSYLPKIINIGQDGNTSLEMLDKVQDISKETLNRSIKKNEENLHNKSKMINYEADIDVEEYIFEKIKSYKFINNLQRKENIDITIQTNKEIHEDHIEDDHVCLRLTYANPVNIHKYISTEKEIFVTLKSTSQEVIYSVMEGDYGNDEERRENLEKEGYDYEEIQLEVDRIIAERQKQVKNVSVNNQVKRNSSALRGAFINEALKMYGWTYSQELRWNQYYADCSSIVVRALINTGLINDKSNLTTRSINSDSRFYEIPMNYIETGDILWYEGHMEIYMGGNNTFGAFRPGKPAGYATGINRFTRAYRIDF